MRSVFQDVVKTGTAAGIKPYKIYIRMIMFFKDNNLKLFKIIFIVLCIVFFVRLCIDTGARTSATFDEVIRLPAAVTYLQTGDMRFDPNGTLPMTRRIIGTLPMRLNPAPLFNKSWEKGDIWHYLWEFMELNRDKYLELIRLSRLSVTICGAIIALLMFFWGMRLFGWTAGAAAMCVLCLDSNFVAHSSIAGIDIPTTLFFSLTMFAWFLWLENFKARYALPTGIFFGLALLTKMINVILLPIFAITFLVKLFSMNSENGEPQVEKRVVAGLAALTLVLITATVVFNTEYKWREVGRPIGDFKFSSGFLSRAETILPSWIPMPLPAGYLNDLDAAFVGRMDNKAGVRNNDNGIYFYLNGKNLSEGLWYYFLYAWLYKEPIPLMLLLALGAWVIIKKRRAAEFLVLTPAVVLLLVLSFLFKMDTGFRHMLPILPFQGLIAGAAANEKKLRPLCAALLIWMLVSCVRVHPNHLAYFNELAGGPQKGYQHLLDSNVDWGQSLPAVRDYMEKNNIPKIYLANFGYVDPSLYGVKYSFPPCWPEHGVFVVSPQYIYGLFPMFRGCVSFLRDRPPDDIIDYTYFVYKL